MGSGIFYGVGVGPGDPGLLTLKAVELLKKTRIIVAPKAARERESLALDVVREFLTPGCTVLQLYFPMSRDNSCLEQAWEEALGTVRVQLDKGEDVVFLTLGDPLMYSTCIYVLDRLKALGYTVRVIAGVPSFCAAAAAAVYPLAKGDERIALFSWNETEPPSPSLLAEFDSVVLLKVASGLPQAVTALRQAGMLEQSLLVSNCGRSAEEISSDLEGAARREAPPYLSLILARRRKEQ